jgi:hypothetical protein
VKTNASYLLIAAALAWCAVPSPASASCSLFDDAPCMPSFCSVESGDSCQPDIAYKPNEVDQIAVHSDAQGGAPAELNSPGDTGRFLRSCWKPPQGAAFDGLLMDVSFAFDRNGALRSTPNITFFSPDASPSAQLLYGQTVREAILRCSPLPFSARYGRIMERHLLDIRFIVDRTTR